jgi:superfamily II DNA helicase RecQ
MDTGFEEKTKELISAIKSVFGFAPYPWQCDVFTNVFKGHRDILVSAGTAEGKSVCFQAMALLHSEATVLVISPIKALMEDQVRLPNAIAYYRCIL